jgi:hypothetical protein
MFDELTWSDLLDMELRFGRCNELTTTQQERLIRFAREVMEDDAEEAL